MTALTTLVVKATQAGLLRQPTSYSTAINHTAVAIIKIVFGI